MFSLALNDTALTTNFLLSPLQLDDQRFCSNIKSKSLNNTDLNIAEIILFFPGLRTLNSKIL